MSVGVGILVVAVLLATLIGLIARRYDGRFRGLGRVGSASEQVRRSASPAAAGVAAPRLSRDDLDGESLGERATLVHFSSAFCAPCRATRVVLSQVSEAVDGVRQVEIDAESHLELVRRLDVRRTPTVLVLDPAGRILTRASGQVRKAGVLAVLDAVTS